MPVPNHGPTCQTFTVPTRCSRCGERVFYFQCTCGSKVYFDDLEDFARHDCANTPPRVTPPPRNTRLHGIIQNPRGLPDFEREITNALRGWDREGVVLKTVPIRNRKFEAWIKNSSEPTVLDQITNLFRSGFHIETRLED